MSGSYLVVSTYPERGSRNIGDLLITRSVSNALRAIKKSDTKIETIWRAASWNDFNERLHKVDAVVFACLAIRPQMHQVEYPALERIVSSGVPYGVVSAGTNLPVGSTRGLYDGFSAKTLELLEKMNEEAIFLTSRGALTQAFATHCGFSRFTLSGDISFFDERFSSRSFSEDPSIQRIAISDPHSFRHYRDALIRLIIGVRTLFPDASLQIFQHGKTSSDLTKVAAGLGVDLKKIYLDEVGLERYDDVDLHVGFRVHGHVSALARRKYSYLLEQDGRGADYGLTINRRLSAPCFLSQRAARLRKSFRLPIDAVSMSSVDQLLALIGADSGERFAKFFGLEEQIEKFCKQSSSAFMLLP